MMNTQFFMNIYMLLYISINFNKYLSIFTRVVAEDGWKRRWRLMGYVICGIGLQLVVAWRHWREIKKNAIIFTLSGMEILSFISLI